MEFKEVIIPEELASLPINEKEELNCKSSSEEKLVYVCRGQDD